MEWVTRERNWRETKIINVFESLRFIFQGESTISVRENSEIEVNWQDGASDMIFVLSILDPGQS